jgi:hypothetical protein
MRNVGFTWISLPFLSPTAPFSRSAEVANPSAHALLVSLPYPQSIKRTYIIQSYSLLYVHPSIPLVYQCEYYRYVLSFRRRIAEISMRRVSWWGVKMMRYRPTRFRYRPRHCRPLRGITSPWNGSTSRASIARSICDWIRRGNRFSCCSASSESSACQFMLDLRPRLRFSLV